MKRIFTLLMLGLSFASFAQVNVSFKVKAVNSKGIAVDTTTGVYFVGDVTKWKFRKMDALGNHVYQFDTTLNTKDTLSFICNLVCTWDSAGNADWNYWKRYRESFDSTSLANCLPRYAKWAYDRWLIVPKKDTLISYQWGKLCPESPLGVPNITNAITVKVYPSPSDGMLNVELPLSAGMSSLEVYDRTGKTIRSLKTTENNISLDLSGCPAGVYMLRVTNGSKTVVRKVLIK